MNEGQVGGFDPGQPPITPEGLIEPKKRGCLFWGCIISLILIVCIGGCVTIGFVSLVRMVKPFTSDKSQPVPEYQARPGEYEEIQNRIHEFRQGPEEEQGQLILTADDLNALITNSREWKKIKAKKYFRIDGDKIYLDFSMPLKGVPFFDDRHLNVTFQLVPRIVGGRPWLSIAEATANGQPIPPEIMEGLREQNLLTEVEDGDFLEFARTAKSLEVRDGKLILKK